MFRKSNMNGEMNRKTRSDIDDDIILGDNVFIEDMDDNEQQMYMNLKMDVNEQLNINEHYFKAAIENESLVVKTSFVSKC